MIWKHVTCVPFILGHIHTSKPELKHWDIQYSTCVHVKHACTYAQTYACAHAHTFQATSGDTVSRSKVSAFQSDQIQAELCSDDKFINKQIPTFRPTRHSVTMATWPIIFCPTENHSVIGWSVTGWSRCVLHWGGRACVLTRVLYICDRKWARPFSSSRRVRISQPVSVTRSVCSNWAERFPSRVTAVQPSGHVSSCQPPAQRRGPSLQTFKQSWKEKKVSDVF